MKTKVVVVIPNWNGEDMIAKALDSLLAQSHHADIVVVDNGSIDNSVDIIKKKYKQIHLIELPKNTGFDGGVNTGIRYALEKDYDAIAIYNNDAIADKHWLENLVTTMESKDDLGIVSGKQLHSDGKYFDSTGDEYTIWGMPFPRGRNILDEGQYDKSEYIFSAPAAATLFRTKMLEDIGIFDEKFFAYYEDVDISFRAQLAGWKIKYQPEAVIYHAISATSSKLGGFTRYHATKNFFMTYTKNMPSWLYWKYLPLFLLQALRLGISSVLRGGGIAYVKGLLMAFWYLPATLIDRYKIQRMRRVEIKYIDKLLTHSRPPRIPTLSKDH